MNQNLQTLKAEAKSLNRFKFVKIALFFLGIFVFTFLGIVVFALTGMDNGIVILFFTAFFSFIIAFISIVIQAFQSPKKERAFKQLLFQYLWRPIVLNKTFYLNNDYELLLEKEEKNTHIIVHPMIPNRAIESFDYTIKNTTSNLRLFSLNYYTRSSNGNGGSSKTTYFDGFAVETQIPVKEVLYVRSDNWYSKLVAQFSAFRDYRDEGDVLVNGTYTDQMKQLRAHLQEQEFKDISFINRDDKLMILLHDRLAIPKMRKYDDETYKVHEDFLMRLIDVLEYVSDLK